MRKRDNRIPLERSKALFAAKTVPVPETGCIEWTGYRLPDGYGRLTFQNKGWRAHRLAWVWANGPIPEDKVVDHMCGNRACVNVKHLRLATVQSNGQNRFRMSPLNTSGCRGVSQQDGRWRAFVRAEGKLVRLGMYSTAEEAAEVARAAREKYYAEPGPAFASVDLPKEP